MSKTLEIKLVTDTDGVVDVEQTLANAESVIMNYKAERETEDTNILNALDQVFDRLKAQGTRGNMPYVIGQTLQLLGVAEQPAAFKVLEKKVHSFIQQNSQGKVLDKETKQVERPDSMFVIGKGKTGGVARRADLDAAAAAKLADS